MLKSFNVICYKEIGHLVCDMELEGKAVNAEVLPINAFTDNIRNSQRSANFDSFELGIALNQIKSPFI